MDTRLTLPTEGIFLTTVRDNWINQCPSPRLLPPSSGSRWKWRKCMDICIYLLLHILLILPFLRSGMASEASHGIFMKICLWIWNTRVIGRWIDHFGDVVWSTYGLWNLAVIPWAARDILETETRPWNPFPIYEIIASARSSSSRRAFSTSLTLAKLCPFVQVASLRMPAAD
jgi:hypothetical protein